MARLKTRPADRALAAEEWEWTFHLLKVRSGGQCEAQSPRCIAPGGSVLGLPRGRTSIQHRRARGMGGTGRDDANCLANLLLLCGDGVTGCHGWVETEQRGLALARGLWVPHEYDGDEPIPVEDYPLWLPSGRRVFLDRDNPMYRPHPDPYGVGSLRQA